MRYFTADLHLGDKTVARLRGYGDNVDAHDALVASALATPAEDDELWLLGDLCDPSPEGAATLRELIPCREVHVVVGNHDSRSVFEESGLYDSVEHYAKIEPGPEGGYEFVMSHYPMTNWEDKLKGSYMLHGHIHSLPEAGYPEGEPPCPQAEKEDNGFSIPGYNESNRAQGLRRFDVGVDANHFRLVSAEEVVAFFTMGD